MADLDWLNWLNTVMRCRPSGNSYLDSERGIEVGKIALQAERENFAWRRGDPEYFWIDVQLMTKYKLSDDEIRFVIKMQAGHRQYAEHADERKAYAELVRGIEKLREIEAKKERAEEWS